MKVRLSRLLVNDRAEMTSIAVSCHRGDKMETKWKQNERQTFAVPKLLKKGKSITPRI